MTISNASPPLVGKGAAYFRVSSDKQEFLRQTDSIAAFEKRHGVRIVERFQDDMPRDLSAKRVDFQRMLGAAEAGRIQWIVIDSIDRFGFADEWELVELIGRLRRAGCKLYDGRDDEWTTQDLMSFFRVGLAGHNSHAEQVEKSSRVLGGKIARARVGEWQGAPAKLGFDVGCFSRATGAEQWRIVWEGRDIVGHEMRRGKRRPVYHVRRLKIFPDGRTERLDGKVTGFIQNPNTDILRITPSNDPAKLAAVRELFHRFATEAVTFFALAKWLNSLGLRNACGQAFRSTDVARILSDESYIGYATFCKRRSGRFHRYDADGGIVPVESDLRGKETESDIADVIRSDRLFEPLVDRKDWAAVRKKLAKRTVRKGYTPKNPKMFLAGLVVCAGCGRPMISRSERGEYYCSTWDQHRTRGAIAECPCERNGVPHDVLEGLVGQYLSETQQKIAVMTSRPKDKLAGQLWEQLDHSWDELDQGLTRLEEYVAEHFPEQYAAIMDEQFASRDGGGDYNLDDHVTELLRTFRANFDPIATAKEIAKLEAEHTDLTRRWADLPTPRAKEKAKRELAELEQRIATMEQRQAELADIVERHYHQIKDLQMAIADARQAMTSAKGAQALRRKAEAVRGIVARIDCEFVATGKTGKGPGSARSKLAAVVFHPVAGDTVAFTPTGGNDDPLKRKLLTPYLLRLLAVRYTVGQTGGNYVH